MRINKIFALMLALALACGDARANDMSNSTWSETDSNNNSASPNGWTPGVMTPNQVEPTAQAMMGGLKRWWDRHNPVLSTTGSSGAYTITLPNTGFPTAYQQGETFCAKANFASVGGDTLQVNTLGVKPLYVMSSEGAAAILANEIALNAPFCASYDSALNTGTGGFWLLVNPARPAKEVLGWFNASNTAEVTFALPAGFTSWEISFHGVVPVSNLQGLALQASTNNCSTLITSANYSYAQSLTRTTDSAPTASSGTTANSIVMGGSVGNALGGGLHGSVTIFPAVGSSDFTFSYTGGWFNASTWGTFNGFGAVGSSSVNCVGLLFNSGNIAQGNFTLYGVRGQ